MSEPGRRPGVVAARGLAVVPERPAVSPRAEAGCANLASQEQQLPRHAPLHMQRKNKVTDSHALMLTIRLLRWLEAMKIESDSDRERQQRPADGQLERKRHGNGLLALHMIESTKTVSVRYAQHKTSRKFGKTNQMKPRTITTEQTRLPRDHQSDLFSGRSNARTPLPLKMMQISKSKSSLLYDGYFQIQIQNPVYWYCKTPLNRKIIMTL